MANEHSWMDNATRTLTAEEAGELKRADGSLHNLYKTFLSWPGPLLPAHRLYKSVMHAPDSPLDFYTAEFIATHVAIIAGCAYAQAHHGSNFIRLADDRANAEAILQALRDKNYDSDVLVPSFKALAKYTDHLSRQPDQMRREHVDALRSANFSDPEIFHVNQIAANFAYWVRVINGLGIETGDEKIGMEAAELHRIVAKRGVQAMG